MGLEVKDVNEVREFVLLDGTDDKVAFKWPVGGHPIGPWTTNVDAVLLALRERFAADPRLAANCAMVDGIRLAWCFTAMEVERLNARDASLRAELDAAVRAMKDMAKELGEIRGRLVLQERVGVVGPKGLQP